jgi:predicted secreted hydrolase
MKRLLLVFLFAMLMQAQYRAALPGYRYVFPHDHFDHPDFQTEWWYYTGNLRDAQGREMGFELTFFRQAVDRAAKPATWAVRDVYLAHLAFTDITGQQFFHAERLNRAGPGLAGIDEAAKRVWNGNWQVTWVDDATMRLQAIDPRFSLSFVLKSRKRPVIHGENGVSQKATGEGRASHYVSLTRLEVSGEVNLGDDRRQVTGLAWMDHEFFTHQLDPEQVGWDWMSLQLNDGRELMVFQLRRRDGTIDPYSSGTLIEKDGRTQHLPRIRMTPGRRWKTYPVEWTVEAAGLKLKVATRLNEQELVSKQPQAPTYWEGAVSVRGDATGVGYLEMTGYREAVSFGKPYRSTQ